MNNKTFCILPWIHTHLNTEGDVFPCCVSWDPERTARVGWIKDSSLEELFNNDFMKQLRLDMLAGIERPDVCKNCLNREAGGFKSSRQGNNEDFKHEIPLVKEKTAADGYVEPIIKSWDIRFSNLCNLKCRTCGPLFSTSWAQEKKDGSFKIHAITDDRDPLENQYDNVEKIYFAGGEPLIMPEHFRTLQELIRRDRAKNISLIYNSNLTKLDYNQHNLLNYWKQFKRVVIGVSIDATHDRAKYIRHGTVWAHVESNLHKLMEFKQQCSTFDFYISPTVGLLNVHHICDMHRYLWEERLMPHIGALDFNMLMAPDYYDCRILPTSIKHEIKDKILNHIEWLKENQAWVNIISQYQNLIVYLDQEIDNNFLNIFCKKTSELDIIRNEKFVETFPEYIGVFNAE